ncbi:MAG: hypothetical protein IPL46_17780 [Saprospiraceae bacterium]|nr:hypothetical protein [Saprospiraceae bacterium]
MNEILTSQHTLIFISHFPDEVPDVVDKQLELIGQVGDWSSGSLVK